MLSVLTAVWLTSSPALAVDYVRQQGNISVGIGGSGLGAGPQGRYYLSDNQAAQATIGFGYGTMRLSADYLYYGEPFRRDSQVTVGWYAGGGPVVGFGADYASLAAQGALGLQLDLDDVPIGLSMAWRPTLVLGPLVDAWLGNVGGGLHYTF